MSPLSIVIPAYKPDYLGQALASLASQTTSDFEVVVADDASPTDLGAICANHAGSLDLRYVRFDDNLGGTDLTAHWTRAIEAASHDWIWLMGDDDELEPQCVATMLRAIAAAPTWDGLWHADVVQIDSQGMERRPCRPYPLRLDASDYVLRRFKAELSSFACEYVFRRSTWSRRGGFVRFPLAWCSDDATWIRLASRDGIRTVTGPQARARWRWSGQNISSMGGAMDKTKAEAMLLYLQWLRDAPDAGGALLGEELKAEAATWFLRFVRERKLPITPREAGTLARKLAPLVGGPAWYRAWQLWRMGASL